jgi:hypothetical protein
MKITKLMLVLIGAAIILSGCSKEESVNPDQSDPLNSELKADKIYFEGAALPTLEPVICGDAHYLPNGIIKVTGFQSVWEDVIPEHPLLTGFSHWDQDMRFAADGKSCKTWGKATLVLDNNLGEWHFSFQGNWVIKEGSDDVLLPICDLPPPPTPMPSSIITGVCKAVGKSGAVKGMVGEWTYIMDTDAGFFYTINGWYH